MLAAALQQTVQMGWTRPEEVRWVARLSDRVSARRYAKLHGGPQAARAHAGVPADHDRDRVPAQPVRRRHGTARRERPHGSRSSTAPPALRPYVILPPELGQPTLGGGPPPAGRARPSRARLGAARPARVVRARRRHPAVRCRLVLSRPDRRTVARRPGSTRPPGAAARRATDEPRPAAAPGRQLRHRLGLAFATDGPVSARVAAVAPRRAGARPRRARALEGGRRPAGTRGSRAASLVLAGLVVVCLVAGVVEVLVGPDVTGLG